MLVRLLGNVIAGTFWLIAGIVAIVVISLLPAPIGLPVTIGPFGALILLVMVAATVTALRHRRGMSVLQYLAQCVRLNLPLPRMLNAAERGESWPTRRRLRSLADAVAGGETIDVALRRHVPEVSDRALGAISVAMKTGQLPATLDQLTEADRRERRRDQTEQIVTYVYELFVLVGTVALLSGVMVIIMPQYTEIFKDYNTQLPGATVLLLELGMKAAPLVLGGAVLVGLALAARSVWTFSHGRPGARLIDGELADPVIWRLPLLGGMARDRGLADACQSIEQSLHASLPLERAADEAATLDVSTVLRKRLRRFADALRQGHGLRDAAGRARLPRLMRGMLATVEAGSDAAPVFAFVQRYYAGRYVRKSMIVRELTGPLTTLLLAGLVGFIAYALFAPLVELIWSNIDAIEGGL